MYLKDTLCRCKPSWRIFFLLISLSFLLLQVSLAIHWGGEPDQSQTVNTKTNIFNLIKSNLWYFTMVQWSDIIIVIDNLRAS